MEISEIKVKLVQDNSEDKLQGFCTITFDREFVVRDLKIIRGNSNSLFVAMPSRKLTDRCPSCGCKNHLRARYCNDCGRNLPQDRATIDERGRAKLHTDIAHPINAKSRERISSEILKEYQREVERSKQPGYRPPDLGSDYDDYETLDPLSSSPKGSPREQRAESRNVPKKEDEAEAEHGGGA